MPDTQLLDEGPGALLLLMLLQQQQQNYGKSTIPCRGPCLSCLARCRWTKFTCVEEDLQYVAMWHVIQNVEKRFLMGRVWPPRRRVNKSRIVSMLSPQTGAESRFRVALQSRHVRSISDQNGNRNSCISFQMSSF